jgi:hypothetical protein
VDGRTLRPPAEHRHWQPAKQLVSNWPQERLDYRTRHLEVACRHPITLPYYAHGFLAAHVARRRLDGAGPDDPLFTGVSVAATLNRAIRRGALYVGHQPWWLDRDRIRHRNLGSRLVTSSWMTERGLTIWPPHADFAPEEARDTAEEEHRPAR